MKINSCCKATAILLLAAVLAAGCGMPPTRTAPGDGAQAGYLTLTDDAGRSVVLQHKPERIVVLAPSFLDLLYAVGGKAAGRPSSNSKAAALSPQMQDIPEVGLVYNINVEKVVALQPDLVIAMQGMHDKLVPVLESNQLPVLVLQYKTYDDVFAKIGLFGDIAGTQEKAQALVRTMKDQLKQITDQLPAKTTKIAILHATSKSVSLELDNSIAGNTAKLLQLQNVAGSGGNGSDTTPYSLEKLVESDPDIIFVVTMGNTAEIQKTMRDDVENNPAWATLRAVRDKKVMFLPSELFLLNPGLRMPEAAHYMAKLVYPEIYAHDR